MQKKLFLQYGENPYLPPKVVIEDVKRSLDDLNRYPTMQRKLLKKIASYEGISEESLLLTNGADKALRLLAETFIAKNNEAICVVPTFPVFTKSVSYMGGVNISVALSKNYRVENIDSFREKMSDKTRIIYLANPNNPTANLIINRRKLEKLLRLGIIVVVDEVYCDFCKVTAKSLLGRYRNLVIVRSFSKGFSLASMRVAYIMSSPVIINKLSRIELSVEPFSISTPSLVAAMSVLNNIELMNENLEKVKKIKKTLNDGFSELGIKVYDSQTSFMLFSLKSQGITEKKYRTYMKNQDIIVKDLSAYTELDPYDCYMGLPEEKQLNRVLRVIKKMIKADRIKK